MNSTDWHRPLLPGPTAMQWANYTLIALAACAISAIGAVAYALLVIARTQRLDPVAVSFVAAFLLSLVIAYVLNHVAHQKVKREVQSGYTTAAQGHNEVPRLHSPTGVVMREAGQPNLTKTEWEAAMSRVRAHQSAHQDAEAG